MDLDKISAYFHLNELVMNLKNGKSEVILSSSSQRLKKGTNLLNVMHEGNKINFVTQYNYLGTIIDNHLNLNKNFNRTYKRASTRLRLLECHRPHLTVDATIKVYLSMIVLIMTYSSTIRLLCNDTQCKKLQSLVRRDKFIIKLTVTSISSCLNHDICTSVKICLLNKFN